MIRAIEAATFEKDGYGMEDTVCPALALWAYTYWFIVKPLSSIKTVTAEVTFVFVGRHVVLVTIDFSISSMLKQFLYLVILQFVVHIYIMWYLEDIGVWRSPV